MKNSLMALFAVKLLSSLSFGLYAKWFYLQIVMQELLSKELPGVKVVEPTPGIPVEIPAN